MRYAYDEINQLTSGVIFFFEKGDDGVATETFKFIVAFEQSPASIIWNGFSLVPSEVLRMLTGPDSLERGYLGVRFTVYEDQLLEAYLKFLRKQYPSLSLLISEVRAKLFSTVH